MKLTGKKFQNQQPQRFSQKNNVRISSRYRKPFWLPASSFYLLSVAMTIAFFFLVWAIFLEGGEETPWIFAGVGASCLFCGAVFLREVILRKARRQYLRAERQLDYNLTSVSLHTSVRPSVYKLSLDKNALLIEEIKRKSEAASVLAKLPEGHWEVFELCNEYLLLNEEQLETVGIGSPRRAALRSGRVGVEKLHKFHLLNWVETKTRLLTQEANKQANLSEKIESSQKALATMDLALKFYPEDENLKASKAALDAFVSSVRISHWIEEAERETFKENHQKAINLYEDALSYLDRENVQNEEKIAAVAKINAEIELIKKLKKKKSRGKEILQGFNYTSDNEND